MIFKEFDNIYISFSGGKDSGILLDLCLDYMRRNRLKRRIGVFHMDYEIQYSMTIDYVDRVLEANKDMLDVYRVCVPFRVRTCTSMYQNYWRPWDEAKKEAWVREMPEGAMTVDDFPFYNRRMWDYEFQTEFSRWLHQRKAARRTCCLVGIRTQESYNRWRTIYRGVKEQYKDYQWSTKIDKTYITYIPSSTGKRRTYGLPTENSDGTTTNYTTSTIKPEYVWTGNGWQVRSSVKQPKALPYKGHRSRHLGTDDRTCKRRRLRRPLRKPVCWNGSRPYFRRDIPGSHSWNSCSRPCRNKPGETIWPNWRPASNSGEPREAA